MKKTRVVAIECPKCGDLIYSRARHDFHWCSCKEVAIDGGFDYVRLAFTTIQPKQHIKYVNATRQELYDDWNTQKNKFGFILTSTKKNGKLKSVKG
jgi:hypothetical protein